jgi:GT2 family glycosyltransferase
MPGTLDLSVIIVSWNVRQQLQHCLESIFRLPLTEQPRGVFVVDNASPDGTAAMVRQQFPQVTLIANTENRGFAAANNQAIARIQSGDVLLLNPDTLVHPGAFPRMLQAFTDHPKAGIVGPKLLNTDGSIQPSVRRLPTFAVLFAIALKFTHIWKNFPPLVTYMEENLDPEKEQPVGQVMGAAFLIRRSIINLIGRLDEGYHVWFEEVDYCKRAADAGWETWYVPSATVTHVGGQSFGQLPSVEKQRQWSQSVLWYSHKYFSRVASSFLRIAGGVGIAATRCAVWLQRHTLARLAAIPVLLALLASIASSQVGLLSDDWDWYYEGRMTQQELTRPLTHNVGGAFYRPLATYSYALDYVISPYSIPVARTQQFVLFAATVVLLVLFVWQLTGQAFTAIASGTFFSVWPQHHEVTTWLGSRPDLLSLLWILAALVTFTAAIQRKKPVLYVLTVLWAGAAILSKESGVLAVPALFLVAGTLRQFRNRYAWATVVGSGIVILFFLYVRSIVLGQLIGGYGDAQTQVGVADLAKLFLSTVEGWLNWSWLSVHFPAHAVRVARYVIVSGLGVSILTGLALHWRAFWKQWRTFAILGLWFLLAVSISLPLLQSVSPMNLNGTRYLYFLSSALAVALAYYISLLTKRKRVAVLACCLLATAWFVNLQPWREASAENTSILSQIQHLVPNPPPSATMSVRGLPGSTAGAFQWFARRSLPEAMVATYTRPDLYAPTALEASPYCSQHPRGQTVDFSYTHATRTIAYLGTNVIQKPAALPAGTNSHLTLTSKTPGTFDGTAGSQVWHAFRGLVVTVDAPEAGFILLQLRGDSVSLYNRTVVEVQPGRNDIYFALCALRVWMNNPPGHSVRITVPAPNRVTDLHLVDPYVL